MLSVQNNETLYDTSLSGKWKITLSSKAVLNARPFAHYLKLHGEYQLRDSNSLKRLIFSSQLCNMQIHGGHQEVTLGKNPLNLIWEAVGGFSKKTSELWIGFSRSQTSRLLQGAARSPQSWHKLIFSDFLCLHSFKPHSYHINTQHLHQFSNRNPVQQL